MARKGRTGVLKRMRELKKAEKAALKRDQVKERRDSPGVEPEAQVATKDDLEGYGFPVASPQDAEGPESGS